MNDLRIKNVEGYEILDSRGNPTVRACVTLENGARGWANVPSGASTGKFEAVELRDGNQKRFGGMGVLKAVRNIETILKNAVLGQDATQTQDVDRALRDADGTSNLEKLGANAVLAVSAATCRAAANGLGIELYEFFGGIHGRVLPVPMMNVLNGGLHAPNTLDVQEFMILPIGADSFHEGLRWGVEVYHALRRTLQKRGYATTIGDEGGFAPNLLNEVQAIEFLLDAIQVAGYEPGKDFVLALDAAASGWKIHESGHTEILYRMPKSGKTYDTFELVEHWKELLISYPIQSLEDGLDEDDWEGWTLLTRELGDKIQLVGDDLFVTQVKRLNSGIERGCANAILIKPNQVGTISDTLDTVQTALRAGYAAVLSHRSGETEDPLIADLVVALNVGQIKTGAPCRGERTAKYNRLLEIESRLK